MFVCVGIVCCLVSCAFLFLDWFVCCLMSAVCCLCDSVVVCCVMCCLMCCYLWFVDRCLLTVVFCLFVGS